MQPSLLSGRRALAALAFAFAIVAAPASARAQAAPPPEEEPAPAPPPEAVVPDAEEPRVVPPYFPVNVSFLYPLATNIGRPELWTNLDIALLLGLVGFIQGAQVGVIGWVSHNLEGVQACVACAVEHRSKGVQLGAVFSYADGPLEGIQVAGLLGYATHEVQGAQLAAVANQTIGDFDGLQAAAVLNVARKRLQGAQIAGAVNLGRVDGFQLGAINVSQEVRGLQIGILNVARRIDGLQIGVVNITDNLDGESLGIAPIPRRGGIHLVGWGSNTLYGNAGIKFASRWAYSIISAALHSVDKDGQPGGERQPILGAGLTLGAQFKVWEGLRLASDVGAYRLFRDHFTLADHDAVYKTRLILSYQFAPRMAPFAGGGAAVSVRGADVVAASVGPEMFAGMEF